MRIRRVFGGNFRPTWQARERSETSDLTMFSAAIEIFNCHQSIHLVNTNLHRWYGIELPLRCKLVQLPARSYP
jgi:hypothetical protein